ncbi:MAG: basic amino acid/polyamine antiporter, family [Clostridiales bacterium]|jgi:APA family basic amino acid/polyamine antiporter|nr:basic amino acid/polyamine antiporter, family [Clostridiales bacterium]
MQHNQLKREISLASAMTMVIGVVIGSGIFFKATPVFSHAGSAFMGIMAWILGGIITMASALTITEIATAMPETGGIFVYLKRLYCEEIAFLFGWMQTVIYVPGVSAALAIILVSQATYFIPLSSVVQKLVAIAFIFFIIIMNIFSTKLGSRIQLLATIGKLIPIAVIIFSGLILGTADGYHAVFGNMMQSVSSVTLSGFGAAILGTLWAYDGWVGVGNVAGEMKNPGKDLPKAIILGLFIVIIVYFLINLAIINVMPLNQIITSDKVTSEAAGIIFGNFGAKLIAAGILVSVFGALNGYLLTGVRVPFAMAQDGLLPFSSLLGSIDSRFETPTNALIFQGVLASVYVLTGSFEKLTNLAMFMVWVFFVLAVAGIFILRQKYAHLTTTYRVPLYPVIPFIGIIGGLYVIISTLVGDPRNAIFGIAATAAGYPIYQWRRYKGGTRLRNSK